MTGSDASVVGTPDAGKDSSPTPDAALDATADAIADAAVEAAVAVDADVTKDFAITSNPNGAWTYGYMRGDPRSADGGALVVFPRGSNPSQSAPVWDDPTNINLGAPAVWRNDGTTTNTGVAPGEFAMHPGQAGEYAMARWTAPASGSYAVSVQFRPGDSGDTDGLLLRNGEALVTEDSTSTDAVHDLVVTLAAGDRLDVAVGSKGDFRFDSTPVRFTIRTGGSDH